ncbi:hypothetical protein [Paraburkholderia youngii]|uniref:hypothetical protein n=1 Tax=Paraburkholderia youngii TaxID=2782701 RepID=UPI003D1E10BB
MSETHFGELLNWHPFTVSKSSRIAELFQDSEDFQEAKKELRNKLSAFRCQRRSTKWRIERMSGGR